MGPYKRRTQVFLEENIQGPPKRRRKKGPGIFGPGRCLLEALVVSANRPRIHFTEDLTTRFSRRRHPRTSGKEGERKDQEFFLLENHPFGCLGKDLVLEVVSQKPWWPSANRPRIRFREDLKSIPKRPEIFLLLSFDHKLGIFYSKVASRETDKKKTLL